MLMKTNWTYKNAYDQALKELQDQAVKEYKELKKTTNKANNLIATNLKTKHRK
jgi:hypothetical protein